MRRGFSPRVRPDEALFALRCVAALDFAEQRQAARAVRAPTLMAWADDDPLVEPAIGEALSEALPPGPRLAFDEGRHNIQKAQAPALAAALVEWAHTLRH